MKNNRSWLRAICAVWLLLVTAFALLLPSSGRAATGDDFTIQVSPSPLVVTLKPGTTQTATLTIRNLSNHDETLVPALNAITIGKSSKDVSLQSTPPPEVSEWVSFDQSKLVIGPGATKQLGVIYKTPGTAGFSYTIAITLNRAGAPAIASGANYKASVAVFNLINIDRPGAFRQLTIENFSAAHAKYEFLPVDFTLSVKNTGNVTVQPTGTVFIQRSFDSETPLATIPLNQSGGYILPNTDRSFDSNWDKGFPRYITTKSDDGKIAQHLSWDWKRVGDLRFGKYVAKVVLIYNDGQRDIPLVASYSFWVIPWRLILVGLLLAVVVITGIIGWGKIIARGTGKLRKKYATRKH